MNNSLPPYSFYDDFYFWFNKEKKEEYYATPLYLYNADFNKDDEKKVLTVFWKGKEPANSPKEHQGLKYPATLYCPYVERLGMLLLRFLNANLSTYESAYKTFFFAYGFEILKDVDEYFDVKLKGKYEDNKTLNTEMERIYNSLKDQLIYIQQQITDAVNYIYNISNIAELKEFSYTQRYAVYLIKNKGQLYKYNKNDYIFRDSYANKYMNYSGIDDLILLKQLKEQPMLISMNDIHKSNDMSSICYAILEELSQTPNYPIKQCQSCFEYFIPTSRLDEIYCDYPKEDGKTCREKGAFQSYNERLKQNKAMGEYRKTYQQKFAQVKKNKGNIKIKDDFEKWKKLAKEKINKLKHHELTEDEVYQWILKNK